jgi:hypothetical protein
MATDMLGLNAWLSYNTEASFRIKKVKNGYIVSNNNDQYVFSKKSSAVSFINKLLKDVE